MDEPSLGLAPLVVREMFVAIKKIVHSGTTILLVEQNTQVALSAAYYGYVLERGIDRTGRGSQVFCERPPMSSMPIWAFRHLGVEAPKNGAIGS